MAKRWFRESLWLSNESDDQVQCLLSKCIRWGKNLDLLYNRERQGSYFHRTFIYNGLLHFFAHDHHVSFTVMLNGPCGLMYKHPQHTNLTQVTARSNYPWYLTRLYEGHQHLFNRKVKLTTHLSNEIKQFSDPVRTSAKGIMCQHTFSKLFMNFHCEWQWHDF